MCFLMFFPFLGNGQVNNTGNLRMHAGSNVGLFGNLSNNGDFSNNSGTLYAAGSNPQVFGGNATIHTNNFTINKASNSLQLDNVLQIAGILTFRNGRILTDHSNIENEFVEFLDGAMHTGSNDESHIDGVIRKTGNDAFRFPLGSQSVFRPISISAPALVTDHFTAYYNEADPDGLYNRSSLGAGINHVSACEYWMLNRTGGNSSVSVTLSWAMNSCGVDLPCDLLVARWDGAQWVSAGNGGVAGTLTAGTLVSGTGCSEPRSIASFSPFTLGSSSSNNPLPIALLSFEASVCGSAVCLAWQTASETDNDFFTVEKSKDGKHWEHVVDVEGAGNSYSVLNYNAIDRWPFMGLSYYRLKQTDFNGAFGYSPEEAVRLEHAHSGGITLYPNPSSHIINIKSLSDDLHSIRIFNAIGQELTSLLRVVQQSETHVQFDISNLAPGIYHVKAGSNSCSMMKL